MLERMVNPNAHLSEHVFDTTVSRAATRDGFGTGVVEAGTRDKRVVVLCADLKESTRAEEFEKAFPERFIEMGVAEQGMATIAAGMAAAGKIPFIASYAAFSPGRNYEQLRTTVAISRLPVKIMGMHAGVSVGPDGATHQMLEDIGLMRMLPHLVVIDPVDAEEARKAVVAAAETKDPTYIRFRRSVTPTITTPATPFVIGKALTLFDSQNPRIAFISTGTLSYIALTAARALLVEGIETTVLHVPTIKPLDREAIVGAARAAGRVVTLEEHQVSGGFGSAVAELLASVYPVPMRMIGMQDTFGESGTPEELFTHFHMDTPAAIDAAHELLRV